LVAYDVSKWLRKGRNVLVVRVDADHGPALLLAEVSVRVSNGRIYSFGTDANWRTALDPDGNYLVAHSDAVASYGAAPWGVLPEVTAYPHWLPNEDVWIPTRWAITIGFVVMTVAFQWLVTGALFCPEGVAVESVWTSDAILHLPMLVVLLALWLTCYDVRFPYDWCFRAHVLLPLLACSTLSRFALLTVGRFYKIHGWRFWGSNLDAWKGPLCVALLAFIVALGFWVRARGLADPPMGPDEVMMTFFSRGILKKGFPYVINGSFTRWMSTYELVPYPIAASSLIFGASAWANRVPAQP
jgi:hypothetical protein